jgi:hypothetical protein
VVADARRAHLVRTAMYSWSGGYGIRNPWPSRPALPLHLPKFGSGESPSVGTVAGLLRQRWAWTVPGSDWPSDTVHRPCRATFILRSTSSGSADIREMNIDDVVRRFWNRNRGGKFKEGSLTDYEKRFRQTVDMYRNGSTTTRLGARRPGRRLRPARASRRTARGPSRRGTRGRS